ncbi:MAG TPA: CHAT domain-containing protein [Thermoanaerobaculia bacterium]|jgi:CHAT domain-containing protein|nr:CHAT domain-containing protein [Thermoanaerobaculia bacterium]
MSDVVPRHPGAQVMAAFVDGTLNREEVATVAAHLRDCSDCRTVVGETAQFKREEEKPEEIKTRTNPWWLAAAAVLAAIAVTAPLLQWNKPAETPIAQLIAAAPRDHRKLEPRLAGFPWARLQASSRGIATVDPVDLKLNGAVGEVLEQTLPRTDADSRCATGVAYLLIDRPDASIAALEHAAAIANDARAWNYLAAARIVFAEKGRPSQLPLALADVDRALRIDVRSAEALFNRALILQRMGLREQASAAWQRYLEVDPGSEWSVEARAHLARLGGGAAEFDPKKLETMAPDALARQFPGELRVRAAVLMLADWGDAVAASDDHRAAAILNRVRLLGDALARTNGERLLRDAVAAIDGADDRTRRTIAAGHRQLRDGRFMEAADSFTAGGSPMALIARYRLAVTAFNQGRSDEANEKLAEILGAIDSNRYRGLAADVRWQLATCANAAADWGAGTRHADAAAVSFRDLGESANAAFMDNYAALSLELIGEPDLAWQHRLRSFAGLSGNGERRRLTTSLQGAAFSLGLIGKPAAAAAMLDVLLESEHLQPSYLTFALADRARFATRNGDAPFAKRALDRARAAAQREADPALRETLHAQIELAEATLPLDRNPGAAILALNRTITTFTKKRTTADLANAYLHRARALRDAGNLADAAADYASALAEVETQRTTFANQAASPNFLDTAAQILEDTIELRLRNGDVAGAFAIADRARVLLDSAPGDAKRELPKLAPGVVLVEYAVLPRRVVAFCLTSDGIAATSIVVERFDLETRIASFVNRIRRRAPLAEVHADGSALYRLLIDPLRSRLANARELVIVPDRQLYALPFAALRNESRQKYLAEEVAIRFATSAAFSNEVEGPIDPVLIVADPPTPQWPRLPFSAEEAMRIAGMYRGTLLSGAAATRSAFVDAAADSALIHFAGHANSDATTSYGALLFAANSTDSGVVGSSDVARLRLSRKPLVVLAACGTFRGDALHVGGMSSLARAFLIAGARGVVGTLWEIDDDVSASLFLRLHQHLMGGADPADALRLAQSDLLQSPDLRLAHPAAWAPVEYLTMSN